MAAAMTCLRFPAAFAPCPTSRAAVAPSACAPPPPAAVARGHLAAAQPCCQPCRQRQLLQGRRNRLQAAVAQASSSNNSSSGSSAPGKTAAAAAAEDATAPLELLRRACRTKAVDPDEVLTAMQQVEAAHKQQPSSLVQGFPGGLTGTWRLVFSTPAPIKQWQYIPVLEDAVIDVDAGTIDLVSIVGPLNNAFKGRCSFEQDPAAGKCDMSFGFTATEATWFGRWDTKSEFAEKRKTYSFFLLTDDMAIANSSGGPKTLMCRVK